MMRMVLAQKAAVPARARTAALAIVSVGIAACASASQPGQDVPATVEPQGVESVYRVYVANESSDLVSRVAFSESRGAWVDRSIPVGLMPSDNDGAHGITVAPDGEHWFLTLAHGSPNGYLWTFTTGTDSLVSRTELGLFPATMAVTPDASFLLAVNFNLHGDPVPSNVSIVHLPTQTELAKVPTCITPHGSRVDLDGRFHYSACMRSEQMVQIDLRSLRVSGRFSLRPGEEGPLDVTDDGSGSSGMSMGGTASGGICMPTWVEPAGDARVYVACNRAGVILEVDTESWTLVRRLESGQGPYNLELTPDRQTLVATLKGEQAVQFIDLSSGTEVARVPTSRAVTHGVVVSPDGRFAFISNESIGSLPGTVDVIDMQSYERVGTVEVGQQAGGIDFWSIRGEPRP